MTRATITTSALALVLAAPCLAQAPRPVELGIDGGIAFTLDDPKVTTIQLPGGQFRVGFFLGDQVSLEPAVSFNYVSIDDFGSGSEFSGDLGLLLHLSADRTRPQTYLRPFVGMTRISSSADDDLGLGESDESSTRLNAGAGIGVKLPWHDRLAVRLEGTFGRLFEEDEVPAQNVLGVSLGLSFFTR